MRSIAISIDEASLEALDGLTGQGTTRSELIRHAVAEYLARRAQEERETCEARVLEEHRELLARKHRLSRYAGALSGRSLRELDAALAVAVGLEASLLRR